MVSVSVADELAIALKASREALAEKDAELSRTRREFSGSEAKLAKLAAELEATKTRLETVLELHPTKIDGNIACAIFSHLPLPKDRVALAAVSKVFKDAEKADASLPDCGVSELLQPHIEKSTYRGYREAFKYWRYWYERAAEQGNADALCMMGDLKSREREPDNLKEACEFYRKAVEKGHAGAMIKLGHLYVRYNNELGRSREEVVELWQRAAEMGDGKGMFYRGWLYEKGCGVEKNTQTAIRWYRAAAKLGRASGCDALRRLGVALTDEA